MEFEKIVDLHCHILPGIDDGSPDLEHSLDLARAAVADGVTHILATPHHLDNNYVNHRTDVIKAVQNFQNELAAEQIALQVFPGQEVHINGDLPQRYADLLGADEKKRYMLLEFPHSNVPAYAKRLIFELQKLGTTPIIVHPERNKEIQKDLNILYDFIQHGALAQVTATSYAGGFGDHVADISKLGVDGTQEISKCIGPVRADKELIIQLLKFLFALFLMAEYLDHLLAVHHFLNISVHRA